MRNKIFKDVYNRFVENRNLFIDVKITNLMPRLIRSVFSCDSARLIVCWVEDKKFVRLNFAKTI